MRDVVDVKEYLRDNPDELVVSVYEKLKPGVLCSFPVDDMALYCDNIKCSEILPYMEPKYNGFHWLLIWAKIRNDRELVMS
jgi:hypothetical protein